MIQADIDASGVANAYPVDVALIGDLGATLTELLARSGDLDQSSRPAWRAELDNVRAGWDEIVQSSQDLGEEGEIGTGAVVAALRRAYPGPINLVSDCASTTSGSCSSFKRSKATTS
jgi:thiamine pyrophosphate-dependent acetolactate synthase large subunit-like protein